MRHGKIIFLVLAIALFVVLIIPIFQNMQYPSMVMYFKYMSFLTMYKITVPLCMLDWALITLYIQSLFTDITRPSAKEFDLG